MKNNMSSPQGVSQWLAEGKKYGYYDYWEDKFYEDLIIEIAVNSEFSVEETKRFIKFVKKLANKVCKKNQ